MKEICKRTDNATGKVWHGHVLITYTIDGEVNHNHILLTTEVSHRIKYM
jgi:hypothetical protein